MRLKAYLSFNTLWGGVVDALLAHNVPRSEQSVEPEVRINVFLQLWQTYQNKQQTPRLKSLIDIAKKYRLRIEGIAFSRTILRCMPIWYHKEADPTICSMNHTAASTCLRTKHQVRTVGDAQDILDQSQSPGHQLNSSCSCEGCSELREMYHCDHPHGCINQTKKLLDTLPEKWDPRSELPEDYQYENKLTEADKIEKCMIFDARVTTEGSLADIFRIFTDETITPSKKLLKLKAQANRETRSIIVATDGSCGRNGEDDAQAGAGIFIANEHPANRSSKLPRYIAQSNQTGEVAAAKIAAEDFSNMLVSSKIQGSLALPMQS
ncbi:hypothetical protein EV368DRAFT_74017 [Lentinula lateritia]|nr:hypothetical protein EV368DRAFT_74017 [Lentinula lateritia]